MPLPPTTIQSRSTVGHDQIGGDQTNIQSQTNTSNSYFGANYQTLLLAHLEKLKKQVSDDERCTETIERLGRFHAQKKSDDVVGLKAKLSKAGKIDELEDALEKKEIFAKLLEKYSHFSSAQEVFACLLSRAEYYFSQFIKPQMGSLSEFEYNQILDEKVIQPTVQDCCPSILAIDHTVAMGMIYWLAERCFIRWHKV